MSAALTIPSRCLETGEAVTAHLLTAEDIQAGERFPPIPSAHPGARWFTREEIMAMMDGGPVWMGMDLGGAPGGRW